MTQPLNRKTTLSTTLLLSLLIPGLAPGSEPGPLTAYQPPLDEEFRQQIHQVDLDKAKQKFMRKCSSCHEHERAGGHGKGPHLWNVMGRQAGTIPGFAFSDAMKSSGHTWDYATLDYYLTNTARAVPGLSMEFRGLRRVKDRAALIAFLRTLNDTPPELP